MNASRADAAPSSACDLRAHADAGMALEHQLRAEVFVVHADQALRGASRAQRKILHGVAVGAELPVLRVDSVGGQPVGVGHAARVEIRRAGYETVTPARDHVVAILACDHEGVAVLRRDALESDPLARGGLRRRNPRTRGESRTRGRTGENVRRDSRAARIASKEGRFMCRAC